MIALDLDNYRGMDLARYKGMKVKDMEHVINIKTTIYNDMVNYTVVIEMQGVHNVTGNSYMLKDRLNAFEIINSNYGQDDLIWKHIHELADKLDKEVYFNEECIPLNLPVYKQGDKIVLIKDGLLELITDITQGDIYKHDYQVEEFNDYHVIIIDNNEDKVVAVNLNNKLLLEVKSGGWLNKMRLLGM